ncbi:hypothetical protein HPB51_020875 [Rhipicephalus microplus]|uniref:PiggyBac transposable element-derived protein domain-containing protein n=1 Tax=Rhipicephalus microplus TaxID=6941 RepID=A0A9J6E3S6_RHIMP|nr:hypothetical protein HPB51_020875 [Rhipicephalus microplus]
MLAILYLVFTVSLQYMVEICCHQASREWRLAQEENQALTSEWCCAVKRSGSQKRSTFFFFLMFFTAEVVNRICVNTNKYAWTQILKKQSYAEADGSWKEVTAAEMMKFIGLLIYMGIVELPRLHLHWSRGSLFPGFIPPKIMSGTRFFFFFCSSGYDPCLGP